MDITYKPALPEGFKRFECGRCGYKFVQKIYSPVIRCKKCEYPCISIEFKNKKLDPYSEMKLYWLKNPKAWEDNIQKRAIANKEGGNSKVKMKDGSYLPQMYDYDKGEFV